MHDLLIPLILLAMLLSGVIRRVPVYDAFLEGAKSGLKTAVNILPCLIGILAAIALLTSSGAMETLLGALAPVMKLLGMPEGVLPVFLMRPFSGSASLAILEKILLIYGPDSFEGRTASTMMGSSETIFYTATLYLAAAGVKRARHAIPAALLAWMVGGLASAWFCRIL